MQTLITDAAVATMAPDHGAYGLVEDGAIAIGDGVILWVGPRDDCPSQYESYAPVSHSGRLVTPGLIDCHTHVVHGGNRAREFELRLNGATYEEVARAGGGIVSTVTATRSSSEAELLSQALIRVDALIAEGITTVEIKSGYGLDCDTELKMLRVARQIGRQRPVTVVTTFLGAHTIPAGMDGDIYLDEICIPTLEKAHAEGFVDAVDGFCESIAFTPAQIERLFVKANDLGLPVKLHAEQLNNLGGAPRLRPGMARSRLITWNMPRQQMPNRWPLRVPSLFFYPALFMRYTKHRCRQLMRSARRACPWRSGLTGTPARPRSDLCCWR